MLNGTTVQKRDHVTVIRESRICAASRYACLPHVLPFQFPKLCQEKRRDLEFVESGNHLFVLVGRQRSFDNLEQDAVFFLDVRTNQIDEPAGKVDELRPFLSEERVLNRYNERAFLIVFEQHLAKGWIIYVLGSSQLREQSTLLLALVIIVGKRTQESKDRFDIIVFQCLMIFDAIRHLLENVERAQNGLVVLSE